MCWGEKTEKDKKENQRTKTVASPAEHGALYL
jgi:hypothetical protein